MAHDPQDDYFEFQGAKEYLHIVRRDSIVGLSQVYPDDLAMPRLTKDRPRVDVIIQINDRTTKVLVSTEKMSDLRKRLYKNLF